MWTRTRLVINDRLCEVRAEWDVNSYTVTTTDMGPVDRQPNEASRRALREMRSGETITHTVDGFRDYLRGVTP